MEEALKDDSTENLATAISRIFMENFDEHFDESHSESKVIAEKVIACFKNDLNNTIIHVVFYGYSSEPNFLF